MIRPLNLLVFLILILMIPTWLVIAVLLVTITSQLADRWQERR